MGKRFSAVFDAFRRVTVFVLGVLIFIDGLLDADNPVPELIIGMVMVGILPIENVVTAVEWRGPKRRRRAHEPRQDDGTDPRV